MLKDLSRKISNGGAITVEAPEAGSTSTKEATGKKELGRFNDAKWKLKRVPQAINGGEIRDMVRGIPHAIHNMTPRFLRR